MPLLRPVNLAGRSPLFLSLAYRVVKEATLPSCLESGINEYMCVYVCV